MKQFSFTIYPETRKELGIRSLIFMFLRFGNFDDSFSLSYISHRVL